METEKEKFVQQSDVDQLAFAIGHYIMAFENVMNFLRMEIVQMCYDMQNVNWELSETLLVDLTADPLLKRYDSILTYTYPVLKTSKGYIKQVKDIYNEIDEAIKYRNSVAHAHWFIESKFDYKIGQVAGSKLMGRSFKFKRTKGVQNAFDHHEKDSVEELKSKAQIAKNIINKLMAFHKMIEQTEMHPLAKKYVDKEQ